MASKTKQAIQKGANQRPNLLSGQATINQSIQDGLIVFNFKFLDSAQGQTFCEWEKEGILSQALDVFKNYSSQKLSSAFSTKFKSYKDFPKKTAFTHPKHVPEDARWASMHLQGKECVIGHIHQNVFYVVFLDKDHRFYISDLQDR
jgi:hypothetical protein